MTFAILAAALVATAAQGQEECRFEATREATIRASTRDRLELIARSGKLVVEGQSGASEVRVVGRACASSRDLLDELVIESGRNGTAVRVEVAEIDQDFDWSGNRYARLDLEIVVPAGMAANIEDGSGEMTLSGLGALSIDDGSGEVRAVNISGDVRIDDGSGSLTLEDIDGDVEIEDGSGEVEIRGVTGSVTINDGSGAINVTDVRGNVRVPSDGSGGVDASDVEGDLTVASKGSGSVQYRNVRGTVDVPDRDRRRRGR
jgi:DUF4097 and DUF4098 domain-containing protein YvlB